MIVKDLQIENLRNHKNSHFEFGSSINVLYGENGAGKTTVLEAISIASLSKSFLPASDTSLINIDENAYNINLSAVNDIGIAYSISVSFSSGGKKKISTNYDENLLPKDIIGEIPIVILSPDYKAITFGAPQDRRSFIDSILCQTSKLYMENLLKLRKCLKQRNNILSAAKKNEHFDESELAQWTYMLIHLSADIINRRKHFIDNFISIFEDSYRFVSQNKETVSLEYDCDGLKNETISNGKQEIQAALEILAQKVKHSEQRRGTTLFGPQRDDLKIIINGGLAREYASQGQHKSLLVALKLAEFQVIKELRNETPIFLLDDIFSELDDKRSRKVLELIQSNGAQIFITLTNPSIIEHFIDKTSGSTIREIINNK